MLKLVVACCLIALALGSVIPDATLDPDFLEWEGRIVGGSNAVEGQFPYQVSMRSSGNAHFCGGTMFSTQWVLCAAHCTQGRLLGNTVSWFGAVSRTTGGVSHASARIVNHPNYSGVTLANDISIIQTAAPVSITASIAPAELASDFIGGGVTLIASGWGQTSHPGSAAATLQFLAVQSITNADCRSRHSAVNAARVHDNTICTFTRAGEGMCMGDSGGPIAVGRVVHGAVSWGIACAQGFPDVYARVSSHRPWILSITG